MHLKLKIFIPDKGQEPLVNLTYKFLGDEKKTIPFELIYKLHKERKTHPKALMKQIDSCFDISSN